MNSEDPIENEELMRELRPMRTKPILQALSWLGGIAAGGAFVSLITLTPTRTMGATRAVRARWRQQQGNVAKSQIDAARAQEDARASSMQNSHSSTSRQIKDEPQDDPS